VKTSKIFSAIKKIFCLVLYFFWTSLDVIDVDIKTIWLPVIPIQTSKEILRNEKLGKNC
jgi:hypothetical protein